MSKQSEKFEPGLAEARNLIEYIFKSHNLSSFDLSDRQLEIVKLKWNYGFTDKQIAEKLSIGENRVKEVYRAILIRIFNRMIRLYTSNPDTSTLQKEIKKLKEENEKYKRKFAALSLEDKQKFGDADIIFNSIHDIGLSKQTSRALAAINIYSVSDLLQYRLSALLMRKGVNTKMTEEIENFTRRHHLKMAV